MTHGWTAARLAVTRRLRLLTAGALAVVCLALPIARHLHAAPQSAPAPSAVPAAAAHAAVLDRYCLACHTSQARARGAVPIALDGLDLTDVAADRDAWEKVVLKLRAGVMPPAGAPRPDAPAHEALTAWLESELDRTSAASPDPGRTPPFHRLNRTEYRNAVRDLLALDVDVAALLPADDASFGFDNIAGVLKLSPTLLERYLAAAQKISRLAVGTPPPLPAIDYFRVADDLSQDEQLPGLPFGTRGGTRIPYVFPADGEYEFRPRLTRDLNEGVPLYTEDQTIEISIDGQRVGTFTLPAVARSEPPAAAGSPEGAQARGISQIRQAVRASAAERAARNRADESWNLRVPVTAGARDVVVTFVNRVSALEETPRLPFARPYPAGVNMPETRRGAYLRSVEISGPHGPATAGDSDSRRRIFVCQPIPAAGAAPAAATAAASSGRSVTDVEASEDGCARTILERLVRRAYRRPVEAADVDGVLAFYRTGRASGGFDAGIEYALRRLLVSPEFLLRVERDPAGAVPGAAYTISDVELASRLSFFLWSSIPDDELLDLAAARTLGSPPVLEAQVRRMLRDPRAEAFVANFAGQWLFLRNLSAVVPVQSLFPDFDDALRQSFRRETELFVGSIVAEDRSALDLLRADYTFVNERLARHYGLPGIKGTHFRRVTLPAESPRRGLLGHGSILTVTSYPDRTSPVVRGKWILENLLGTPPPAPPANVPPLRATGSGGQVLPMRARMEAHRANPTCASCHAMMDPLGLSLENFDAIGRWRTLGEASSPIDASGSTPDGRRFQGADGLREALLGSQRFVSTLTEKMMTYALGRGVEATDLPAVRAIVRAAADDDYRFSALLLGIVQSAPFTMRRTADAEAAAPSAHREPRAPDASRELWARNASREPRARNASREPWARDASREPWARNASREPWARNASREPWARNASHEPWAPSANPEPGTLNPNREPEPRTRTRNVEPGTLNRLGF